MGSGTSAPGVGRSRVVLGCLLAWLAWRAGVGTVALLAEIGAHEPSALRGALAASEDERLARTLAQQDARHGHAPGYHLALVRALERHVAPSGVIHVLRPDRRRGRKLLALELLVAPRSFRVLAGEPAAAGSADGSSAVLDFEDALRARLAGRLTPVALGTGWALWR